MLNPFPELLAFGLLSPFLIRVCLGVIFVRHGYFKLFKNRAEAAGSFAVVGVFANHMAVVVGMIEMVGGIMLLAGFLTQVVALILSAAVVITGVIKKKSAGMAQREIGFSAFVFLALVSLLFSGAGFLAFDLPL